MKKNIFFFVFNLSAIGGLLLNLNSCNTTEPPTPPPNDTTVYNTINITIEWTDLYRIKLKWNISTKDTLKNYSYELYRKDETGVETKLNFYISGTDTSYIDGETDSLASGKNFIYSVRAFDNKNKLIDTSRTKTAKTLAPTSHNITWQIDTLGQPGNFLYDVWGLDENNVYSVGFVELQSGNSSIIKWDGIEWKAFTNVGGVKYGIFGFSEASIFVVGESSNRGIVAIWDGTQWMEYRSDYFLARGDTVYPLYAVWGSSPDDVWAVGDKGTIIHWDGVEWRKIDAGITTRITSIWGKSESEIYIVPISGVRSSLYKFDGSLWNKIFDDIGIYSTTLWSAKSGNLIIGGTSLLEYDGSILRSINIAGRTRGIVKVRGSNINNIFTAGDFGEITHFDGLTWQDISDFEVPNGKYRVLHSVWCTENKVFIVGEDENRAIVITGTIH